MNCILEKQLSSEHKDIKDKRYAESFVNCPLFSSRQICYWCCLHIRDIAEPLNRPKYSEEHPDYEKLVPNETKRDWDEIWHVCSRCSQ